MLSEALETLSVCFNQKKEANRHVVSVFINAHADEFFKLLHSMINSENYFVKRDILKVLYNLLE